MCVIGARNSRTVPRKSVLFRTQVNSLYNCQFTGVNRQGRQALQSQSAKCAIGLTNKRMIGWRFQTWWQYCGAENLHSSKVESRCTKSKHNYRIKTYSANLANRSHVNLRLRCSCVNVTNHEQCTGNYCWQSNGQCRGWDRPNPTDKCNIAILQKWPHIVSVIFVYVYFIYLFIYLFIQ